MATGLGERIRAERERAGLTQPQLAELVGVSGRTIGNWERGDAVPRNSLTRLEDALPGLGSQPTHDEHGPDVMEAIRRDKSLLPEARAHLLNQYQLLLRVAAAEPKAVPTPEEAVAEVRELPYVARKRPAPRKRQP